MRDGGLPGFPPRPPESDAPLASPYANGGRASGIGGLFPIPGQPQGKQLQALQAQAQALLLARAKAQAQKPVPQVGGADGRLSAPFAACACVSAHPWLNKKYKLWA